MIFWIGLGAVVILGLAFFGALTEAASKNDSSGAGLPRKSAGYTRLHTTRRVTIVYNDAKGDISTRTVNIVEYQPRGATAKFAGRCETARARRTFRFDRVEHSVDAGTGEIISNLRKWIRDAEAADMAQEEGSGEGPQSATSMPSTREPAKTPRWQIVFMGVLCVGGVLGFFVDTTPNTHAGPTAASVASPISTVPADVRPTTPDGSTAETAFAQSSAPRPDDHVTIAPGQLVHTKSFDVLGCADKLILLELSDAIAHPGVMSDQSFDNLARQGGCSPTSPDVALKVLHSEKVKVPAGTFTVLQVRIDGETPAEPFGFYVMSVGVIAS